ncbi:hypothetical protein ACFPPD_11015 [Cohnella suwonensis]|uniref:Cadherin domain-containing protein n=1 Tax=Cohnella suwonensis TaxID=696072 RepID=A0ABW0LWZ8_9BACL
MATLYLDRAPVGVAYAYGWVHLGIPNQVDLAAGKDVYSGNRGSAEIDEVRVWNSVRPESDIVKYKNRRLSGNEPGLSLNWNFDTVLPSLTEGTIAYGTRDGAVPNVLYEDDGTVPVPILEFNDNDAAADAYTLSLSVANGMLSLSSTSGLTRVDGDNGSASMTWSGSRSDLIAALKTLSYRSVADYYGNDALAVSVADSGSADDPAPATGTYSIPLTIHAVNDSPSFVAGTDVMAQYDEPPVAIPGWATGITAGQYENQGLSFALTTDRPDLFRQQPAIDPSGTLSFQPALDTAGTANVAIVMKDDGGTAMGGADATTGNFRITVSRSNRSPLIAERSALRKRPRCGRYVVDGRSQR